MKSDNPIQMVEDAQPGPDVIINNNTTSHAELADEAQAGKVEVAAPEHDPAVVRRFLWKCDIRLIPCLGIMYLLK